MNSQYDEMVTRQWAKARAILFDLGVYADSPNLAADTLASWVFLSVEEINAHLAPLEEINASAFFEVSQYNSFMSSNLVPHLEQDITVAAYMYAKEAKKRLTLLYVDTTNAVTNLFRRIEGHEKYYPVLCQHKEVLISSVPARTSLEIEAILRILTVSTYKDKGQGTNTRKCIYLLSGIKESLNTAKMEYMRKMLEAEGYTETIKYLCSKINKEN